MMIMIFYDHYDKIIIIMVFWWSPVIISDHEGGQQHIGSSIKHIIHATLINPLLDLTYDYQKIIIDGSDEVMAKQNAINMTCLSERGMSLT